MLEPLNHPVGSFDLRSLEAVTLDETPFQPAVLPRAEVHTAQFEVPHAQVMARLPPSLHPSTPAYAALTFYRIPESEVGAFELAIMSIACRSTIRPRLLTLSSFASSDAAGAWLRKRWGFASRTAEIKTRLRYDAAHSEIALGGRTILIAHTARPEPLLGTARAIRYPQALNHARWLGQEGLAQFDVAYDYSESYRGVLTLPTFDAQELTGGKVIPTDMIAGSYAKLEAATFMPPKMLMDLENVGKVLDKRRG